MAGSDIHAPHAAWLEQTIALAQNNAALGHGGPFAAIVVKDGQIIATGSNGVTTLNDPTAHAEVQAVRAACAALGSFQLTGCTLYSSCEPCPMCLGALYWARPDAVFFAASRHDAAAVGFDDAFIYDELTLEPRQRRLRFEHMALDSRQAPFEAWMRSPHRRPY